jgi:hypothetical protein
MGACAAWCRPYGTWFPFNGSAVRGLYFRAKSTGGREVKIPALSRKNRETRTGHPRELGHSLYLGVVGLFVTSAGGWSWQPEESLVTIS